MGAGVFAGTTIDPSALVQRLDLDARSVASIRRGEGRRGGPRVGACGAGAELASPGSGPGQSGGARTQCWVLLQRAPRLGAYFSGCLEKRRTHARRPLSPEQTRAHPSVRPESSG